MDYAAAARDRHGQGADMKSDYATPSPQSSPSKGEEDAQRQVRVRCLSRPQSQVRKVHFSSKEPHPSRVRCLSRTQRPVRVRCSSKAQGQVRKVHFSSKAQGSVRVHCLSKTQRQVRVRWLGERQRQMRASSSSEVRARSSMKALLQTKATTHHFLQSQRRDLLQKTAQHHTTGLRPRH